MKNQEGSVSGVFLIIGLIVSIIGIILFIPEFMATLEVKTFDSNKTVIGLALIGAGSYVEKAVLGSS